MIRSFAFLLVRFFRDSVFRFDSIVAHAILICGTPGIQPDNFISSHEDPFTFQTYFPLFLAVFSLAIFTFLAISFLWLMVKSCVILIFFRSPSANFNLGAFFINIVFSSKVFRTSFNGRRISCLDGLPSRVSDLGVDVTSMAMKSFFIRLRSWTSLFSSRPCMITFVALRSRSLS